MKMNPFMDQGVDVTLLPGSCPMEYVGTDYSDTTVLNGVEHIVEHHVVPAWRMNNGELIAIKDMETSHIKNCIHMIYKSKGIWRHQYLRYFENELRRRKYERLNYQEPF